MGNTWEVYAWEFDAETGDSGYVTQYRGESMLGALWAMWRAKREGFGCVKLEWR